MELGAIDAADALRTSDESRATTQLVTSLRTEHFCRCILRRTSTVGSTGVVEPC
jgi:hypothetical protein